VFENHVLKLLQIPPRLNTKPVNQSHPSPPVNVQRVHLPPGPIKREHELHAQPLPKRLGLGQYLELGSNLAMPPTGQLGVEAVLEHQHPLVLDRGELRPHGPPLNQIGERTPTPQPQGLPEQSHAVRPGPGGQSRTPLLGEPPELIHVNNFSINLQPIPRRVSDEDGRSIRPRRERPPDSGDSVLNHLASGERRLLVPEGTQHATGGHHLVGVQQKVPENRPLNRAAQVNLHAVINDF